MSINELNCSTEFSSYMKRRDGRKSSKLQVQKQQKKPDCSFELKVVHETQEDKVFCCLENSRPDDLNKKPQSKNFRPMESSSSCFITTLGLLSSQHYLPSTFLTLTQLCGYGEVGGGGPLKEHDERLHSTTMWTT